MNEITFNSALLHELRSINMLQRFVDPGKLDPSAHQPKFIHIVSANDEMRHLDASSKLNAEWAFLQHIFEIGRKTAEQWLAAHFDDLGERSSVDLADMFKHLKLPGG